MQVMCGKRCHQLFFYHINPSSSASMWWCWDKKSSSSSSTNLLHTNSVIALDVGCAVSFSSSSFSSSFFDMILIILPISTNCTLDPSSCSDVLAVVPSSCVPPPTQSQSIPKHPTWKGISHPPTTATKPTEE